MNISCDVFLLNVSSGDCKYSINLPVIGQKCEITMKHEEKIILYSCDHISLFHKQIQIWSELKKHSKLWVSMKNGPKRLNRKKEENTWKRWFLIIAPRLGMGAAFWLAGFYCLLLDPGKTIINLIIFFPAFAGNTKELKQCPWAAQSYSSD